MQYANIHLKIDKFNEVPKRVSPAEAVLLTTAFEPQANTKPCLYLSDIKDVDALNDVEVARLRHLYRNLHVSVSNKLTEVMEVCYPGTNPTLPQTFKEVEGVLGPQLYTKATKPAEEPTKSASAELDQKIQDAATPVSSNAVVISTKSGKSA